MAAADYDEVFSKWKYEYASDKDGSQVRRYNGLVYTRWKQDGTFDKFVDATEGVELFQAGFHRAEGYVRKVPFATMYYQTKKGMVWLSGGDGDYGMIRDQEGKNINRFVDKYNSHPQERVLCLCDKDGIILQDHIRISNFDLTGYKFNEDYAIELHEIDKQFSAHEERLEDVEYEYLHEQLPRIEQKIDARDLHGRSHAFNTLHEKVKKRMQELRPSEKSSEKSQENETDKKPSIWSTVTSILPFGQKPACHIQEMLDRLAALG